MSGPCAKVECKDQLRTVLPRPLEPQPDGQPVGAAVRLRPMRGGPSTRSTTTPLAMQRNARRPLTEEAECIPGRYLPCSTGFGAALAGGIATAIGKRTEAYTRLRRALRVTKATRPAHLNRRTKAG